MIRLVASSNSPWLNSDGLTILSFFIKFFESINYKLFQLNVCNKEFRRNVEASENLWSFHSWTLFDPFPHRCARRNLHFHSTVKTCITNPQNFQKMIAAYKSEIPYIFIHIDFINLYWSYPFTNARKWKKSRSLLFLSIYVICWNNQLAHRKIENTKKKQTF